MSWFIQPNGPKDGLNPCFFLLAFLLAKEEKLSLGLVYQESLYARRYECLGKVTRFMARYMW